MDYRYLLTLSRPRFWLYLAGPVLVGATYAATELGDLAAPVVLALAAYFLVPANVLLYGINDVFDRDVDEHNPKKEEREARYRGSRDVLVALAASGVLGLGTFAITPPVSWPWLAGFFVLAVGYSAPPVRFKTTPVLDSVSNGLYVLPGAAAYAAVAGTHPPALAVLGGWLWTMGMHTFSAIPDIEPDREAGIRTTATWLGESTTFAYCIGVWALAAAAFALLDPRFLVVFGVYPAFCAWVAASDVSVDRAYWWFPYLNGAAGMLLTLGGLWRLYG